MREHGRHVRIGVGHQSPDYQWWHGHPALDGDLLRIKGMVSDIERRRMPTAGTASIRQGTETGRTTQQRDRMLR